MKCEEVPGQDKFQFYLSQQYQIRNCKGKIKLQFKIHSQKDFFLDHSHDTLE